MRKKLVVCLMLSTMIFSLTACGSSKETNISDENTKQTVDTQIESGEVEDSDEDTEQETEEVVEETYIVTSDDICAKVEDLSTDILNARLGYRTATTNIDNVSRHINGFENYFISNYDVQELKGCTQLGSFIGSQQGKKADMFTVTATIKKTNFDDDGFTYYEGSDAELNATVNLAFHLWAEHDSSVDVSYNKDMSVILVLDNDVWKIKHFNQTSLGCDFTHIDDENKKSTEEILGTEAPEWKKAYIDYFNQSDRADFIKYFIEDINADGVPEIFTDNQTLYGISMIYVDKSNRVNIIDCVSGYAKDDGYVIASGGHDVVAESIYQYNANTGVFGKVHEGTYTMPSPSGSETYSIDGVSYNSIEEYRSAFNFLYGNKELERVTCDKEADTILQVISEY